MSRFTKTTFIVLLMMAVPLRFWAQQPKQIKVSEISIHDLRTIEERVFVIHTLLEQGYFCYKSDQLPNVVEVYVPNDASDMLSDFDFFLDNILYDQLDEFSYYDKSLRGELFVQWREEIDDELFKMLYEDFTRGVRSENATCETAFPFCTDNGAYNFPAGVNSGSPCGDTYNAQCSEPYKCSNTPGQSTNCLNTAPNPAFYYMRIDEPGNLNIYMHSTPQVDIDFDCWGPFDDINTACDQLACSNIVDCSYSTAATEHCHINNAQNGQYYILLITNYSNDPCNINFENIGTGTTDCSILPPLVSGGGPYCVGDTIQLTAHNQPGATFSWSGPNGFTSTLQNPSIPNCTMEMAGIYTCTITLGEESSSAETEYVEIVAQPSANFSFNSACEGDPLQFTSTSTTNPVGQPITSYEWDFGDGQTGSGETTSHIYAQYGEYEVTLITFTGEYVCSDQKTLTVPVYAVPVATITANPSSVIYGGTTTLTANVTTPGSFTYHWEPSNMVTNPDSQTTQTYPIQETQVFTVTITNTQGGCSSTVQVTVSMAGSNLTATATADQYEICENGSTTLHALPQNGTGIYTYSWTPANLLNNPNAQNPVATPPVGTTTFSCSVDDGLTIQIANVSILVLPKDEKDIYETTCDQFYWDPEGHAIIETDHSDPNYTTSGIYQRTYYNQKGCDSIVRLNLTVNHSDLTGEKVLDHNLCDSVGWDVFGEMKYFNTDGQYRFNGTTSHGCDSSLLITVANMKYTPNPEIKCDDENVEWPHYPITATEFNINRYTYSAFDSQSDDSWLYNQCEWGISQESWRIVPSDDNRTCTVYAMEWVADTIWPVWRRRRR